MLWLLVSHEFERRLNAAVPTDLEHEGSCGLKLWHHLVWCLMGLELEAAAPPGFLVLECILEV